ncbi:hypothetical protein T484DRAFT_1932513 [Baffinella frigidus]|nr:hypothetical protein T484DRAFT_1932513 [Cryptophyta sp. CCMP2293]
MYLSLPPTRPGAATGRSCLPTPRAPPPSAGGSTRRGTKSAPERDAAAGIQGQRGNGGG